MLSLALTEHDSSLPPTFKCWDVNDNGPQYFMESDEKSNFFSSRAMLTFCKPNQSPEAPNTERILRKGIPLREGRRKKY